MWCIEVIHANLTIVYIYIFDSSVEHKMGYHNTS